ncbi:acyl-CoA dehydrogenase family protein [Sciscionella sediminilitoris]|uniref:acyl-CoA dehydrogenase family protein n=1 Tax=Sciscionella sediminilitoris TaxID=1445613 RepID=UPI00055EC309|nr:acyl-CoA dehydrogenase family protein [Sciscionella sp. SE31]
MTDWIERAREVAETLAVDAVERDAAGAEPLAEAELLRKAELPALLVPAAQGGAGQDWGTALAVVREIAAADGSVAQLIGYHYVNQYNLWFTAPEEVAARLGGESARRQWLWGDAVNPTDPELLLTPDGEGYLLDGTKRFATGTSSGDIIVIGASLTTTGEPLLAAIPSTGEGISFGGDWDNIGQRLSASGSVTFERAPVATENVLGSLAPERITPRATLLTPAIQAVFGHLYLGIAEGALRTAREYTRTTSRPWIHSGLDSVTADPYVLATYGELAAKLAALGALADRAAAALVAVDAEGSALTWAGRGELAEQITALKIVATETALEVTERVFEVTGARATASKHGFDRFWRNVRTHTLHDPVAYKRRELGAHYLTGAVPEFSLYT